MIISENDIYRRFYLATIVLGLLVFFWGLGDIALLSFNEARRALPAQAMFNSGDWLLPRLNGELYLAKPPLLYWLQALCAHLLGAADEWAVRLPSAIAAGITVWMTYRYALRQFGRWPALFAAQLLIANVSFAMAARRAEIEMLLIALCAGALLAAMHYIREGGSRRWIYLSYLLLGLAMLTKGPLVLLLVTLPLLVVALYRKDTRCWQVVRSPLGWLIFVAVGVSWYAIVTWKLGPHIWASIIRTDIVGKMHGHEAKPLLSYVMWQLVDFLPFCFLVFYRPQEIWRQSRQRTDLLVALAAVVVPLLVFSLFSNKHAKYLLPIYPFIALFLGMRLGQLFEAGGVRRKRWIAGVSLVLPLLYAGYYAAFEAKIFAYRVTALTEFGDWSRQQQPAPFYTFADVDERLLYYSQQPVKVLNQATLRHLRDTHQPMLVLAESRELDKIVPPADCVVKTFKPYLKNDRALLVLGFGAACTSMSQP